MANITEIDGNIFETTCQTIVNSVNCVGVMGKGIALEFKNRYPGMFESYRNACLKGLLKPGAIQLYRKTTPWILNFPSKVDWKHPSKLDYIDAGLAKLADTYEVKGISSIAFPELGTANGQLEWEDVSRLMYEHLTPLPRLDVEIYHYDPNAQDSMFDRFYQRVHRFDVVDYCKNLGLRKRQASLLMDALRSNEVRSMLQIQRLEGFGEKSIGKIYDFLLGTSSETVLPEREIQPELF